MPNNQLTYGYNSKTKFARHLRNNQTAAEKILWRKLRGKLFHNLKFRRQVPIGPYIVDFLCVERKIVIEVDGDSHFQVGAKQRDTERERYLESKQLKIFRCTNSAVRENLESVMNRLEQFISTTDTDISTQDGTFFITSS